MKDKFYMASFSEVFSKTSATEIIRTALVDQGYNIRRVDVKCPSMSDAGQSLIDFKREIVDASIAAFKQLPPGSDVMTFVVEQLLAIKEMKLAGYDINAFYYTHSAFDVHEFDVPGNPFSKEHRKLTMELLNDVNVQICCQTKWGQAFVLKTYGRWSTLLPYFVDVSGLYTIPRSDRKGILWGTRYDKEHDVKGFEWFVDEYAYFDHLRIMVEQSSQEAVLRYLKQKGVEDYDLRVGISGQEKYDFISTSKCAVNLSSIESYGIFMAETCSVIPTYCPKFYPWMSEFGVPVGGGWADKFNQKTHNELALRCWDDFLK